MVTSCDISIFSDIFHIGCHVGEVSDTVIGHIGFRYVMSNAVKLSDIIDGVNILVYNF